MDDLSAAIFALGPHIRYVAYGSGQSIELSQREGVLDASGAASDFFEELLVNPTLLTLARQRGNLDCGGLRHVIVGYRNFNQNSSSDFCTLCPRAGHIDEREREVLSLIPGTMHWPGRFGLAARS